MLPYVKALPVKPLAKLISSQVMIKVSLARRRSMQIYIKTKPNKSAFWKWVQKEQPAHLGSWIIGYLASETHLCGKPPESEQA